MHTTPVSLLQRLRNSADQAEWGRFVRLYTPLLYSWARHVGLQEPDAADLVQDVLLVLLRKLPDFTHRGPHSFRGWLRTVALNKWRDRCRERTAAVGPVPEPEVPDSVAELEEAEYRRHLVHRALQLMQADFQPATWKACWELVVAERPAAAIAAELGLTPGAVYAAKFRVLARLRQDFDGLLD